MFPISYFVRNVSAMLCNYVVVIVTWLVNKIKPQNYLQIYLQNRHIHSCEYVAWNRARQWLGNRF